MILIGISCFLKSKKIKIKIEKIICSSLIGLVDVRWAKRVVLFCTLQKTDISNKFPTKKLNNF